MAIVERGPTDTNNRDDITETAEGLSQESAMHRFVFACIVLILLTQADAAEAQQKFLENFPSYSQDDTEWCAWVSAQMVLKYYGYNVPPQEVAVKTFGLANEKWSLDAVKADENGLPSRLIPDYENAIIALSDNSIEIEEITPKDKDELLFEIYSSIDRGDPIIILSTAPWLYDFFANLETTVPWLYDVYGDKYPAGSHASVIVGYSLDFETNEDLAAHPFNLKYPGVLTSLVSSPPALRLYDPATAAFGEGAYWLSYEHFFDKTTSSKEFLKLIVVKKRSNKDPNSPTVQAFAVLPSAINSGDSFTIDYSVSDDGGSGLKQAELWRKDESSDWKEIKPPKTLSGENGPHSGSFTDSPSAPGKYWYGVHVVDNAGNWNDEKNSNTNGQPRSFEPAEVEVKAVATVREASHAPSEEWNKTFGGQFWDQGYSIESTSDGCYILAGETQLDDGGGYAWLIKTDSQGNEIWKKNIGRADVDLVKSIRPTFDGGYILVGFSVGTDPEQANSDALLIKTDSQGNEIWSNTFGGLNVDSANSVQPTPDGGYIIAGETESFSYWGKDALQALKQMQAEGSSWPTPIHIHPWDGRREIDSDAWLIKTDANGNELWNRTFGQETDSWCSGCGDDSANSVQLTSDGGYILAGGALGDIPWLIRTNDIGDEIWNRTFVGTNYDSANSAQPTSDGGYILAGGHGPDAWLIKIDADGNEIWRKGFGSNDNNDWVNSVLPTSDGGYILAGETASYGGGVWLIKTDTDGNEIWNETFTFGGASFEGANSVQPTSDGGYILAGLTTTKTENWVDAWLIKVAPS